MTNPTVQFDDQTLSATAQTALQAVSEHAANSQALIDRWVAAGNAAAVNEVAERGTGAARKAARRGLNVLKSRGVSIPTVGKKATLAAKDARVTEAWMLSPDGAGVRLLAFSKPRSGGSCDACMIYLRDDQGVMRVENLQSTPARLRAALAKALPAAGYDPVKVPLEWARAKVASARARHAERKVPEPMGFSAAASLLTPVPGAEQEHPFDAEGFELAEDDAVELAKDSGSLHHVPEFRGWLPSQAAVREMLVNVGRKLDPDSPPAQDVVSELLKEEMLAATDRYFTPDHREQMVTWMKDAGISVLAREGESTALKVAATIQVVERCGLVTSPPRDVPFLRAFFEKAVSLLMAQSGGKLDIPVPRPANAPPAG